MAGRARRQLAGSLQVARCVKFDAKAAIDIQRLDAGVTRPAGKALVLEGQERFIRKTSNTHETQPTRGWTGILNGRIESRQLKAPKSGAVDITPVVYFGRANRGVSFMEVRTLLAGR